MSMRYVGGFVKPSFDPLASGTYQGEWTLRQQFLAVGASKWAGIIPTGEQSYSVDGTYSWVAPAGVTAVSVVCVGATQPWANNAYYGRGGGGLGYKNNIAVTPGNSYTVVVANGATPTDSYFINTSTVKGGTATGSSTGGTYVGDGGGNGGNGGGAGGGSGAGGGGAGGYAGNGGNGGASGANNGFAAASGSGGGGGGAGGTSGNFGGGGGGVGLYGKGSDGIAGIYSASSNYVPGGGGGGSYGDTGSFSNTGGAYGSASVGGGMAGTGASVSGGAQRGAVRIIWGTGRSFPNNAA